MNSGHNSECGFAHARRCKEGKAPAQENLLCPAFLKAPGIRSNSSDKGPFPPLNFLIYVAELLKFSLTQVPAEILSINGIGKTLLAGKPHKQTIRTDIASAVGTEGSEKGADHGLLILQPDCPVNLRKLSLPEQQRKRDSQGGIPLIYLPWQKRR